VGSRVRFAQEIGRGLRAKPGKEFCRVFDPHDLFGSLGLTFDACLGHLEEDSPVKISALKLEQLFEREIKEGGIWNPQMEAQPAVRSYLRATRVHLQMAGKIDEVIKNNGWRSKPASQKQLELIDSLFSKIGEDKRSKSLAACWFAAHAGILTKGDCADLINIVKNWRHL
jgi:hypothetical protein